MANLRKVSLALSPEVVADLDYVAGRLGVSRSALTNNVLQECMPDMRKLFEQVPLSPEPADLVRFSDIVNATIATSSKEAIVVSLK